MFPGNRSLLLLTDVSCRLRRVRMIEGWHGVRSLEGVEGGTSVEGTSRISSSTNNQVEVTNRVKCIVKHTGKYVMLS